MVFSPTSPSELIQQDREHLIHPLYHPDEHESPIIFAQGKGAILTDVEGHEYIDGLSCLWNVDVGHGRQELAEAGGQQLADPGLRQQLHRLLEHPGHPAGQRADEGGLPEPARRLLHQRRRGVERLGVQDGPLLLAVQGQAGQGQGHLAAVGLPRRHDRRDERDRHPGLPQDVRADGARPRPHPRPVPLPRRHHGELGESTASRRPTSSRRRSCARAPTRSRRSSPSRSRARAA